MSWRSLRSVGWGATLGAVLGVLPGGAPPAPTAAKKTKDEPAAKAKAPDLPLEAEGVARRSFHLRTDEVTWLSVDVSPGGATLVLEALGDLYTLSIEGGPATQLTSGMAFDSQPAYSPDGQHVAFLSDRDGSENLWLLPLAAPAGGEAVAPRKLSAETSAEFASPAFTPDGEWVVVSRSTWGLRVYELVMYHMAGGKGITITKAKPKGDDTRGDERPNALGAVASPDGRFLYYALKTGGFQYNASFPMWQIARRDRTTGDEDTLTSAPGSAVRPRLSPDGRTLVYATRFENETGLKVRDLERGDERWLAYPVQRDEQESRYTRDLYPGYAFLPDGRELVVTWGGRLHRLDLATGQSRPIPFTIDAKLEIGPRLHLEQRVEEGPVRARLAQDAEPSPDGSAVAFSALARVFTQRLEAGASAEQRSPPGARAFQPAWSPDGQWLVYVTWERAGGAVYKVPAAGGAPVQLSTAAAFYSHPAFSPDGSRIVLLRGARQARVEMPDEFGGSNVPLDLIVIPAAGGDAQTIAPARGLGRPHFGPESDRIYLYSPEGLASMRWDGTDRRTHLKVTGPGLYFAEKPVPASELRLSPDGGWALARASNRFYLLPVPRSGGGAAEVDHGAPAVPIKKLTLLGADSMAWAGGGSTIAWTVGSTFFRLPRSAVRFAPPRDPSADPPGAEPPAEDLPQAERFELSVTVPRKSPQGTIVLRNARILTMSDDSGGIIERGDLVASGNRIVAVGAAGTIAVPVGAHQIDASGTTITPGFIDAHAHWTEIRRGVLDTEEWTFLANLAWGVTAGLDVQTGTPDMFAYQDLIDAGELIGPRAYSTGPGLFSNNDLQTREQARGLLERYRDHYRTRNLKSYIVGNRKQRQLVVQAAAELGMMPTTEGALDLKLDLTHALDGFAGNEHALPVVPLFGDVAQLFAASGTGYNPTLLVAYGGPWAEDWFYTHQDVYGNEKLRRFVPRDILNGVTRQRTWFRESEHIFPRLAAQAVKIARAGGHVGIGAHGQLQGLGYHWEMWALGSGGATPLEVLRAATRDGAHIIGFARDLGSLEPGKMADLVVLARNPLEDLRHTDSVRWVMKNGELYDASTLDRIWPDPQPLPSQWWWDAAPRNTTGAPSR